MTQLRYRVFLDSHQQSPRCRTTPKFVNSARLPRLNAESDRPNRLGRQLGIEIAVLARDKRFDGCASRPKSTVLVWNFATKSGRPRFPVLYRVGRR
jgi:hypothetical protein